MESIIIWLNTFIVLNPSSGMLLIHYMAISLGQQGQTILNFHFLTALIMNFLPKSSPPSSLQNMWTGFVLMGFAGQEDLASLNWLLINQRLDVNILKFT